MVARRKTVELRPEDDAFVERKVAEGQYSNADEVISAAIRILREQEEDFDRLLVKEVLPVHDRLMTDPSLTRPLDEVFNRLRRRHEARLRQR